MSLLGSLDKRKTNDPRINKLKDTQIHELVEAQENYQLMDYILMDRNLRLDGVKIIAISSTPVYEDIFVNGHSANKFERSVIVSDAKVTFRKGNDVEYPLGFITPLTVADTFPRYDSGDKTYKGKGAIEVSYLVDDNVNPTAIRLEYSASIKFGANAGTIKEYLWNNDSGKWEQGDYNKQLIDGSDITKYIGKNNVIKFKLESDDDECSLQLPQIYLKGSAK
jgi:hypothetical protein